MIEALHFMLTGQGLSHSAAEPEPPSTMFVCVTVCLSTILRVRDRGKFSGRSIVYMWASAAPNRCHGNHLSIIPVYHFIIRFLKSHSACWCKAKLRMQE